MPTLAERIQERFPAGLTGVFALGATRTSYILEHNRDSDNPGKIRDFDVYGRYGVDGTLKIVQMFFEMGGAHAIVPASSFDLMEDRRGKEYTELVTRMSRFLHDDVTQEFYRKHNIDPYFAGIDILFRREKDSPQYRLGAALDDFQKQWDYQPGRHKLIWEVAPIPLYTIRFADKILGHEARAKLERQLTEEQNYIKIYELLYHYYAKAVYGTDLPIPKLYIASNRNGDLKHRALLPFALEAYGELRMFFTPYPSYFMTYETLKTIIEDLLIDKRIRSYQNDYADKWTPETVQQMYQNFTSLAADPQTTLGLTKNIRTEELAHKSEE